MTQMKVIEENGRTAEREGSCDCGCGCGMGATPEPREEARPVGTIKGLYRRVSSRSRGPC